MNLDFGGRAGLREVMDDVTGLPEMHQIIRSAKMHGLQELDGFPRSRWILSAGIQAESKILHFHSPDICTMEQHDAKVCIPRTLCISMYSV